MSVSEDRRTLPWIILRQEGGVDPDDGSTVEGVAASLIPAEAKLQYGKSASSDMLRPVVHAAVGRSGCYRRASGLFTQPHRLRPLFCTASRFAPAVTSLVVGADVIDATRSGRSGINSPDTVVSGSYFVACLADAGRRSDLRARAH
ncbi:MAG: hypothetical protein J0J02_00450 [Thiobacillus sp.]|nr:hypothetical protein [Thiobacillus sp.]